LNILDGIARSSSCSEAWSPDVDGVRAMIYGGDGARQVASRGEEFSVSHQCRKAFPDRRSS